MKTKALVVLAVLLAGCAPQTQQAERVDSLLISPATGRVARGESLRYVATALLSTGEVRDVTAETVWTVDDVFVGSTSGDSSVVQGVNMGRTRVRAQYGGMMDVRPLDVVSPQYRALRLEPSQLIVPMGLQLPMRLVAIASDGSEVDVTDEASWTMSAPECASVRGGRLTPLQPGELHVEVTAKDLSLTAALIVTDAVIRSIDVRMPQMDLPAGFTQQLTARATLTDGHRIDVTRAAVWSSEDIAIGSVDEVGLFTGRTTGSVRVTATAGGITGAASVKVSEAVPTAIRIEAAPQRFPAGLTTSLRVLATMSDGSQRDVSSAVSWVNGDDTKLQLEGLQARGLSVGSVALKATLGSLETTTQLEVIDAVLHALSLQPLRYLPVGASWQATATARWSDGSVSDVSRVTAWQLTDASVASVDSNGLVTALHTGSTRLIGFFGGKTITTQFNVTPAAMSNVIIEPSSLRLVRGSSEQLRVSATWTDGTRETLAPESCTFVSLTKSATVSEKGLVTAMTIGNGRVIANCFGFRRAVQVRVPDVHVVGVELTPLAPSIPLGFGRHMSFVATLSDYSTQDLTMSATWSTVNPTIAFASPGVLSASRLGTTTLRVEFGGEYAETPVTVTAATVVSLDVVPSTVRTTPGSNVSLSVVGTFSDGTTRDMTNDVQWVSTDASIAEVNGTVLHAVASGDTEVTASFGTVTKVVEVSVVPPSLNSLAFTPPNSLPVGRSHQLVLLGVMNDGSTQNMTALAQWSSTQPGFGSVSANGVLTAHSPGHTVITAQVGRFTVSANVNITNATVTSVTVDSSKSTLFMSESAQLTVWAYYSDGSRFDVTAEAVMSVQHSAVISVSPSGEVQPVGAGSSTVTATWSSFSSSASFEVVAPATMTSLSISGSEFIQVGDAPTFSAWATYSDGSVVDVTTQATWTTSNAAVLSMTSAGGFSANAQGTSTVSITFGSQTASSDVTVH